MLDQRTLIERTYAEQQRLAEAGRRVLGRRTVCATTGDPDLYLATVGIDLDDALLKRLPSS